MTELVARLQRYMEKASREAKLSTSWISPNAAYDEALKSFVAEVLDSKNSRFLADFVAFHETVCDSGLFNSLSQTTLKLTAPGFPDIYQGQELWDFSLVDPDNRRPVDYAKRKWLIEEVVNRGREAESRLALCRELAGNPRDERFKLFVTTTLLNLRKRLPDLFTDGEYIPLDVEGELAEHVIAFARRLGESSAVVIVPRLIHRLRGDGRAAPCGPDFWRGTHVMVGDALPGRFVNQFTGVGGELENGRLDVGQALEHFPVAALTAATVALQ